MQEIYFGEYVGIMLDIPWKEYKIMVVTPFIFGSRDNWKWFK